MIVEESSEFHEQQSRRFVGLPQYSHAQTTFVSAFVNPGHASSVYAPLGRNDSVGGTGNPLRRTWMVHVVLNTVFSYLM